MLKKILSSIVMFTMLSLLMVSPSRAQGAEDEILTDEFINEMEKVVEETINSGVKEEVSEFPHTEVSVEQIEQAEGTVESLINDSDELDTLGKLSEEELSAVGENIKSRLRSRFVGYNQDRLRELLEAAGCVSVVDAPSCYKAKELASKAEIATQKNFAKHTHKNGKGDAFRHCYWSGLMTLHLSEDAALRIANNHEDVWPNDPGEAEMDALNNAVGRTIGLMIKRNGGTDKGIFYVCNHMANASLLKTLPK